jgi:hypothetical protein
MTTTSLLTVDEFEAMALADRVNTWELMWGEVREVPGSGFEHSGIGLAIGSELRQFVRPRDLGVVTGAGGTFILSREFGVVLIPDVAFVAKDDPNSTDPRSRMQAPTPEPMRRGRRVTRAADLYTESSRTWAARYHTAPHGSTAPHTVGKAARDVGHHRTPRRPLVSGLVRCAGGWNAVRAEASVNPARRYSAPGAAGLRSCRRGR